MTRNTDLLEQLARGETKAQEEVFFQFKDKVYNTILSMVQQGEEAEELTQDVFIEVFRSAATFKGNSSLSTWIYRISVNKALDHLKYLKRKKRFAFLSSLFHPESGEPISGATDFVHPGVQLERKEQSTFLFKAIYQLPEKQQTAFILFEIEGLSYAEIADIMQTSTAAVESVLHRARQGLRKKLEGYYNKMNP